VIVLDTHALLWWRDGNRRLPSAVRRQIETASEVGVPTACCLELASLERRGRIAFQGGAARWVRAAVAGDRIVELPLTTEIAIVAGGLPDAFPGDPVDRIVYATAAVTGSRLVTADRRITAYDRARVVWSPHALP
jgi:PIN domain nuclease of toxin-antitoxin system